MPDQVQGDIIEFTWGVKRGRGGAKKDVQFYESFTYDGVEYFLYDSIYLFKDDENEPYIGKLIKIWEQKNKIRRVKVLWFFRPHEVSNYLGNEEVLENELFLACGDVGRGLANINSLDRSKWFTGLPWEDRLKNASEKGSLILLQNLDPGCTSSEVEDIIWHGCHESCSAKMMQRTAFSSPHCGQAFAIFKTREAAEKVIQKLDQGCLMLPHGRPLVGCVGAASFPTRQSSFPGHLLIDKAKFQMQKGKKDAVSTSHSSQPNTLEYEMAMEWRLHQARSDFWWKKLNKQQGEELRKLKANLKIK
ncbi:hypothetical protein Dimus_019316 [Dionaea muscipula]